ncbi:universal stress protein [Bradyrhizobium sp.]|uniref:universal stress protein n=1 Tax=Bradyrhizobium sp. TaxID=376 RepID=UPI002C772C0F|nr:universal stress protein [Bradyrhizobium sp.]HMM88034.1 universal stress protein [Bradyrhizobium sp.]
MTTSAPHRIMLATDLTPAGDRAFDRAVELAKEWDAELVVLHVVESSAVRPWGIDQRMRNAETEMDRLVRSANQACKIMRHTLIGDPADRMLAHARDIGSDFLITGPAHGKIVGEKLLGSTAARIVRRATVPVLAVRRRPEGPYRSIVSAVDFSDASRSALLGGRTLFPSARFTALHAYHPAPNWSGRNAERSIDVVEAEERERVVKEAGRNMDDLVAAAGAGTPAIETAIMEGEPEVVLADYVARNWPDLVVAGTHGRSTVEYDTIGSVAERFLTTLPCDVLAVPTRK